MYFTVEDVVYRLFNYLNPTLIIYLYTEYIYIKL